MQIEWGYIKELAVVAFSAIAGWIGFRAKQKAQMQVQHEDRQDNKLTDLDKRLDALERSNVAMSERTRSIQRELSELKTDLSDDFKDLKANISLLIRQVMK